LKWYFKLLIVFVLLIAAFGVGFGGYYLAQEQPSVKKTDQTSSVPVAMEKITVVKGCILTTKYVYTMCGHQETSEEVVGSGLVGMTRDEVKKYFDGFNLEVFSADQIVISKTINQYCQKHYILKEQQGEIVILRDIPGTADLELFRQTGISTSMLPADERQKIYYGKVFSSLEDIEEYLESIDT